MKANKYSKEYLEICKHIKIAISSIEKEDDKNLEEHSRWSQSIAANLIKRKNKDNQERDVQLAITKGNERCYKCGGDGWCCGATN